MNTNVEQEPKPYNYELWIPPFDLPTVKLLMKEDLRRALEPFIGRPTEDRAEADRIIQTASCIMVKWEERFELLVDMSVTSAEEVDEIKFGETELGFEFDFPVSVDE